MAIMGQLSLPLNHMGISFKDFFCEKPLDKFKKKKAALKMKIEALKSH
jgi:hypothetical protein